jgi:hypothetical protein
MIKKMKTECEANTLSTHVMCPNTFICIKQDWLCGEKFCGDKLRKMQWKLIFVNCFQMATMTATTLRMRRAVERRQTAPRISSSAQMAFAYHKNGSAVRTSKLLKLLRFTELFEFQTVTTTVAITPTNPTARDRKWKKFHSCFAGLESQIVPFSVVHFH